MIHTLRPLHQSILQILTNIPHHNTHPSHRQQPLSAVHRMGGRRNHVFPANWLMVRPSRCKHRSPPGYPIQSNRGYRIPSGHSMIPLLLQHMGPTADLFTQPQQHQLSTSRACPRRNRKISTIRPTPLTTLRHRRTYPCISPTSLQYNSRSRSISTHPILPTNRKQQTHSIHSTVSRGYHHPIYSDLCPHPKRH